MKRFFTISGNFILTLAAAYCTIMAIVSAFMFAVDATAMVQIWVITALVLTIAATLWRVKGLLAALAIIPLIIIMRLTEIVEGAKWVICYITTEFNKWLFVPVLFPEAGMPAGGLTLFFTAAGVALIFLLTIAICVRRSAFLTILFTAPLVCLTFVLVIFQPDFPLLLALIAIYLTMTISNGAAADDFAKRGLAVFPAFALAITLMGAAYIMAPPEEYRREEQIARFDMMIRNIAAQAGIGEIKSGIGWPNTVAGRWEFNTSNVNVADAGTRVIHGHSLLEVESSGAGTFYVRGYSMQRFDGRAWRGNSDALNQQFPYEGMVRNIPALIIRQYNSAFPENTLVYEYMDMRISRTGDITLDVFYEPYHISGFTDTEPSMMWGWGYNVEFVYTQQSIVDLQARLSQESADYFYRIDLSAYSERVNSRETYLQIDSSTAIGLRRMAIEAGIDPLGNRAVIADQVADFIKNSARYTLSPYITPEGEDFALYFLQTSRRGYCIHFATAATLMFRALDIPARFTSGYVFTITRYQVGRPVEITDREAHAWVEVFYEEIGWLPLEVTPPDTGSGIPMGTPHAGGMAPHIPGWVPGGEDIPDPWWDEGNAAPAGPQTGDSADSGRQAAFWSATATLLRILAIAAIPALILRRYTVRWLRGKRFAKADTNAAIISAWKYITRLSRKTPPPEVIEDLALKARFSQHRMTEEERKTVTEYAKNLAEATYDQSNLPKRLWIKWARAL